MKNILSIQSHVVFGHAGNSSAVFPLQRMGYEVWPIHTVQFSNHTQYTEGWTGRAFTADDINELVQGIANIGQLQNCSAVLTGYQGSPQQCSAVIKTVNRVREANPKAIYVCDPVMGAPDKGCIVAPGIAEHLVKEIMPMADVIVPNQFELGQFTNSAIDSMETAVEACRKALSMGPDIVLVKHLHSLSDEKFSMMLAVQDGCFLAQRPHLNFPKQPVGVGDLISAVFTANLLSGMDPLSAFTHCNNAVYGILKKTFDAGSWELRTIEAQDELIHPSSSFETVKL